MRNQTLRLLIIYNSIFVFAASLLGPLYAIYISSINSDVVVIMWTWSVIIIADTFFTYIISRLSDKKLNKRVMLMIGYLSRALAFAFFVFADSILAIVLIQILLGFGQALGTSSFEALFAEHLDKNAHMSDYSQWHIFANICIVIATLLGGVIVKVLGFDYLFMLMSILSIVSYLGLALKRKHLLGIGTAGKSD